MAHFAKLDENNVVTEIHVIANSELLDANGVEQEHLGQAFLENLFGGTWKQTSYNKNFRKHYAGIGYTYNADIDAFVPPQPFPSWTFNSSIAGWDAPVPPPEDIYTGDPPKLYKWDEDLLAWLDWSDEANAWVEPQLP